MRRYPLINASTARVAFSVFEKDKRMSYVTAPGGAPDKVLKGACKVRTRDEKSIVVFGGTPYQIDVLDLASHQQTPLLIDPLHYLLFGRFSPENRWVSFTTRPEPNRGVIAIASVDGPKPVPSRAWCQAPGTLFLKMPSSSELACK